MMSMRPIPAPAAGLLAAAGLAAALALAAPLAAQSLAQRVAAAPDGTLHFSFRVREGVCGNGENISTGRRSTEWESACDDGPGRVALDVAGHQVTGLRFYVGGRWKSGSGTDLGQVSAREASDYLLELAAHGEGRAAERAVLPASVADSVVVWPKLLDIARDAGRPNAVRRSATFWLSQQAAEAATRGLVELAGSDADREV
ncbi:MAG TPA: hypothetical protein VF832_03250, partial [Longimicrobiales bacterium]